MTKGAWEDDWQRAARERDDLVAERDALAADLAAEKERSSHMVMASTLDAALARVAALEAALLRVDTFMDNAPTVRSIIRNALTAKETKGEQG
jgi:predicted component of type VI protein secretion system